MSDTLLDVEVLVCSLLRSVLRVLGHRAGALLWRLQHHYLGLTVAPRVMGTRNGSLNVSLEDKINEHGLDQNKLLPVKTPAEREERKNRAIPVLSVQGDRQPRWPGGRACCTPELSKNPVAMCGLAACWVGWVPTRDLSGTRTGAVVLTGRSERKRQAVKIHEGS